MSSRRISSSLEFHPVTPPKWQDLERLFGTKGDQAGCWCMWWRLTRSEFNRNWKEGNKNAFRALVDAGEIPGIIAYRDREPVGWCSVAPREAYPALDRSRTLKRVDDRPVWSVVCFFVAKPLRHMGLMEPLLAAAVSYAADRGAQIVEGYPVGSKTGERVRTSGYTGVVSVFRRLGFEEAVRRSPRQPVMRKVVRVH